MIAVASPVVVPVAWTVVSAVGLVFNSWGLFDAVADRRWLRDAGLNGRRAIVANWHVTLNAALTYIQAAFLAAGVVAISLPTPPTAGQRFARMAVQLAFLTAEPVLVALAIEARRYRGRILASRSVLNARGIAADLEPDKED